MPSRIPMGRDHIPSLSPMGGTPIRVMPSAPISICPSPPRLLSLAWKVKETPSPTSSSGVKYMATSPSEVMEVRGRISI